MRVSKTTAPLSRRHASAAGLSIRFTDNGAVAQKWPKKRGRKRHPSERWWSDTWGTAAQMAAHPYHLDQSFAEAWSKGTPFAPRDLLTAAALGQLFEIVGPDGQIMESLLTVAGNPQQTLDLITNTPGAMLFRAPQGWIKVPPGAAGQWLRYLSTGEIIWGTPSPSTDPETRPATRLQLDADRLNQNLTSTVFLPWDSATYDTPARWNSGGDKTKITAGPLDAGFAALVTINIGLQNVTAGESLRLAIRHTNAAGTFVRAPGSNTVAAFTTDEYTATAQTPILAEGDAFQAALILTNDNDVTIRAVDCAFAVTFFKP